VNPSPDRSCWICGKNPAGPPPSALETPNCDAPVCAACHGGVLQPHRDAWRRLSRFLRENWPDITARGSFDLSKIFAGDAAGAALDVHLHFVNMLACRLSADRVGVDLAPFAAALLARRAHPEVVLLAADGANPSGRLLSHDSQVSVLRQGGKIYSALWTHLAHPIAVKICYISAGSPVREPPGHPWHPARQRKIVKLSPYKGDVEPIIARRDLRI